MSGPSTTDVVDGAASPPGRAPVVVAGEGDLPALRALDAVGFDAPWSEGTWRGELSRDDRVWLLVRDDGGPVASAGLWLAPDAGHVLRLVVVPERRREGLGARLVAELLRRSARRGRPEVTCEVRRSNVGALSLYRRLGFVSNGVRPGYYPDGQDAVVLWYGEPADEPRDGGR